MKRLLVVVAAGLFAVLGCQNQGQQAGQQGQAAPEGQAQTGSQGTAGAQAQAGTQPQIQVQGTISEIDRDDNTLTLQDVQGAGAQGQQEMKFHAQPNQLQDLQQGQQVSLTYESREGEHWIRSLQQSQGSQGATGSEGTGGAHGGTEQSPEAPSGGSQGE